MDKREPTIVYHYTSQQALLGILKDKAIWATDMFYLDDASEFKHALEIARTQLDDLTKTAQGEALHLLECIADYLKSASDHHVYVSSFSQHSDSVSQWKLYGSGGHGFAIGFYLSELKDYQIEGDYSIRQCYYDEARQTEEIAGNFQRYLSTVQREPNNLSQPSELQQSTEYYARDFVYTLMLLAPALKKHDFEPEGEWRLVRYSRHPCPSDIWFRPSDFSLIPYQKINLPRKSESISLAKIVIGPALEEELSTQSLKFLLTKHGVDLQSLDIVPSKVTIRMHN